MNKSFWDRFAWLYDVAMNKGEAGDHAAVRYIAQYLHPEDVMYEAACGTCRYSRPLAQHVSSIRCSDYSRKMVETAFRKARKMNIPNMDICVGDVMAIDAPDATFDVVMAANVLHLLPRPEEALRELARILKPDGLLVVPNFVDVGSTKRNGRFMSLLSRLGFSAARQWSTDAFLDFIQDQGFQLVSHAMFDSRQPLCVAIVRLRANRSLVGR